MVGGAFQCWFAANPASCPNADRVKPAGISSEEAVNFVTNEVGYEMDAFAVFSKKGDRLEIKKKTGESFYISLPELNRETQAALPKATAAGEAKVSLWRYSSLEEILKFAMFRHDGDFLKFLRKNDLTTPMNISLQLKALEQARLDRALKAAHVMLPIGYLLTSVACTYRKVNSTTTSGSCAPPVVAPAYASRSRSSPKVFDASLIWAHLEGQTVEPVKSNPPKREDQLLIFQEQGDWIQMRRSFGDASKRLVWLNKKDFPYKIVRLKQESRLRHFIDFLTSSSDSVDRDPSLLESLRSLTQNPLEVDLESAGETKWYNGILWVKVEIRSELHCSPEESKSIATGWLPYISPESNKKILTIKSNKKFIYNYYVRAITN